MTVQLMRPFLAMVIAMTLTLAACGGYGNSNGPVSTTDPVEAALNTASTKGFNSCQKDFYGNSSAHLHVLVCDVGDNFHQNALFFVAESTYVKTDAPETSGHLEVIWRDRDTVALLYGLYMPKDGDCCPTGGGTTVLFQWNGVALTASGPIPTAKRDVSPSRR